MALQNVFTNAWIRLCLPKNRQRKIYAVAIVVIVIFFIFNRSISLTPTSSMNKTYIQESFKSIQKLLEQCAGDHDAPKLSYWNYNFECSSKWKTFLPENHETTFKSLGESKGDKNPKVQIHDIGFAGQLTDFIVAELFFLHPSPHLHGRFLEIGGYYGLEFSNTLFFEQYLGWHGWLFEPTTCFDMCVHNRPLASVFKLGLCKEKKEMHFGGFGKCNPSNASCVPLTSIGQDWKSGFDFVSIDVEGAEMSVLEAIDFDRIEIKVLAIEWRYGNGKSRQIYLKQFGYELVGNVYFNQYGQGDEIYYRPDLVQGFIFRDEDNFANLSIWHFTEEN